MNEAQRERLFAARSLVGVALKAISHARVTVVGDGASVSAIVGTLNLADDELRKVGLMLAHKLARKDTDLSAEEMAASNAEIEAELANVPEDSQ